MEEERVAAAAEEEGLEAAVAVEGPRVMVEGVRAEQPVVAVVAPGDLQDGLAVVTAVAQKVAVAAVATALSVTGAAEAVVATEAEELVVVATEVVGPVVAE